MRVIHQAAQLNPGGGGTCVALGMFDGVHLGHQQVLQCAVQNARLHQAVPVAITFDQHPSAVVAPARTPLLLYSLPQRLRVMESIGIETTWLVHFDRAFSLQSGGQFVHALAKDFGRLQCICVGTNFSFGHKRSGNVALLKSLGAELGFSVHAVPSISSQGEVVSSTRIREMVQAGDLDGAARMLGRPYSIAGAVGHGDELGRKIGFPTANLDVRGLVLPPTGVYAGYVDHDQRRFQAVMNIGYRPTLNQPLPERRVEVHLLDFEGDLYRAQIEFQVAAHLRPEQKFASIQALQEQIALDIAQVRTALASPEKS